MKIEKEKKEKKYTHFWPRSDIGGSAQEGVGANNLVTGFNAISQRVTYYFSQDVEWKVLVMISDLDVKVLVSKHVTELLTSQSSGLPWTVLEVEQYGTACHAGTSLVGWKPYPATSFL